MSATLYIVRHGNTFEKGDVVTRVGGRTDLPLSPSGRTQAQKLADHFGAQALHWTTARSSPLKRTRETAHAILAADGQGPDLQTELFLREIDYGPDENRPEDDVIARIGKPALDAWEKDSIVPPGWRLDPTAITGNWQELFSDLAELPGPHLIVTSNGIARFALAAANPTGPTHASHEAKLATGAYGIIEVDGDSIAVRSWNTRP